MKKTKILPSTTSQNYLTKSQYSRTNHPITTAYPPPHNHQCPPRKDSRNRRLRSHCTRIPQATRLFRWEFLRFYSMYFSVYA